MQSFDQLRTLLATEFEINLFDSCVRSLNDNGNSARLNNFLSLFRELVRNVFNRLAPDEEIKLCSWYVPHETVPVTRAQRTTYVLHGGISKEYAKTTLEIDSESNLSAVKQAFETCNKFTHVAPETFGVSSLEANAHSEAATTTLLKLLVAAETARNELGVSIANSVQKVLFDNVFKESPKTLDSMSWHISFEEIIVKKICVTRVGPKQIEFRVYGEAHVHQRLGPRTEGITIEEYRPMSCTLISPVSDPQQLEILPATFLAGC